MKPMAEKIYAECERRGAQHDANRMMAKFRRMRPDTFAQYEVLIDAFLVGTEDDTEQLVEMFHRHMGHDEPLDAIVRCARDILTRHPWVT